jgi:hypothetical protein
MRLIHGVVGLPDDRQWRGSKGVEDPKEAEPSG